MGKRRTLLLAATAVLLASPLTTASRHTHSSSKRQQPPPDAGPTPGSVNGTTFDYIVVGGGTAGLVVANRLSANGTKVLVIEAGNTGDNVKDRILAPARAYYDGIAYPGSPNDWGYYTTNQTGLNNKPVFWPRGKVLGGSSAVNGAYMVRAGEIEHDAWAALFPGSEADWSWSALWPYMQKSETFTPPSADNAKITQAITDTNAHGHDGPIHYSYPGYAYEQIGMWSPSLMALGIPSRDGQTGQNYDCFIAPSCINPANWTRSYSKTGYFDPIAQRSNLVVLTEQQVTKLNFQDGKDNNGNAVATGVTFAASENGPRYVVNAAKEVILSAGVIGSPQLLQLSGVGPSTLLSPLNIDVVVDLPGVGAHLQDHVSSSIRFNTSAPITGDLIRGDAEFNQTQIQLWQAGDASSLYTAPNDAIAYLNASTIMGDGYRIWHEQVVTTGPNFIWRYSPEPSVQAGYEAAYNMEAKTIIPGRTGAVEILMGNTGSTGQGATMLIQAAIQRPLSQGFVNITSTSPFVQPLIDPAYLQHPSDVALYVAAFKWVRKLAGTQPLAGILTGEVAPGASVQSDQDWENYLRTSSSTEYHPAGSCSMLPRHQGGVVDAQLKVYGTSNVRVIDASIVPIGLSAHLMAPVYGIAEKGADLILNGSKASVSAGIQATATAGPSTTSNSASPSSSSMSNGQNSAGSRSARVPVPFRLLARLL